MARVVLKAVTAVAFLVGLLAGGAVGGHLAKSAPPTTAAAPSGAKPGISLNQWMQLLRDGRLA